MMAMGTEFSVFAQSSPADAPRPRAKRKWRTKRWIRTRDKQQLVFYALQLDVNDLRQQIASLQTTYSLLYARVLNGQDAYIRTVVQYFDMMHSGFHDVLRPRSSTGTKRIDGRQYLYSIMDADMRMGRLPGLDQFIVMWQRYTVAFEDLHFSLASARILPADPCRIQAADPGQVVVVAESRFQARMGLQVVRHVFPSLVGKLWLLDRVLGKTLQGEGQLRLTFDVDSQRVVQVDMTLDMVGALFRVVRDPWVLNEILDGALLTPDCCIGDLSHLTLLPEPDDGKIKSEHMDTTTLKLETEESVDAAAETTMSGQAWQMSMGAVLSPSGNDTNVSVW